MLRSIEFAFGRRAERRNGVVDDHVVGQRIKIEMRRPTASLSHGTTLGSCAALKITGLVVLGDGSHLHAAKPAELNREIAAGEIHGERLAQVLGDRDSLNCNRHGRDYGLVMTGLPLACRMVAAWRGGHNVRRAAS